MPTGTGKSVVIAKLVETILGAYPNQRLLSLTHVKELIEQNHRTMRRLMPSASTAVYSAGLGQRDVSAVTFAGIQSVRKRARLFQHTDLVLIDECHLVSPNANTMYQTFLSELREYNPALKVIGFSATPYRLNTGTILEGGLFTDICVNQTSTSWFRYFVDSGYLAQLVPKRMENTLDTSNIRTRAGEFLAKDVEHEMESQRVTAHALYEAAEYAKDRRKWMVFASSIDHALECEETLKLLGVSSCVVHSKMTAEQRDANIAAFREGKVRAIINRDILTTGFDVADVDCIVMLRPTQSPGLWVQMLGRGTRSAPGKPDCLVLDFAGNTARLGPIDDPVVPRKRGAGGGDAPVRCCPTCATYIHASATLCHVCGHEFPRDPVPKLSQEASSLALMGGKDMPQVEVFAVHSMIAEKAHSKKNGTPMMRVSYYCGPQGVRRFTTYVCFEHPGVGRRKACEWWRVHSHTDTLMGEDPPENVDQAIAYFNELYKPTHIRVWVNTKYPEILKFDYTGTGFGTLPVEDAERPGRGQVAKVEEDDSEAIVKVPKDATDDEIPF